VRLITIGKSRQFETMVSDEDYEHLTQWLWTFAVSHPKGSLIYARRSIRAGSGNITILMHRVIIVDRMGMARPSVHHTVDHDDGNSLNNQRDNLFWRTGAEQMFTRRRLAQNSAESIEASIPY
jgi:HNH endonuclease